MRFHSQSNEVWHLRKTGFAFDPEKLHNLVAESDINIVDVEYAHNLAATANLAATPDSVPPAANSSDSSATPEDVFASIAVFTTSSQKQSRSRGRSGEVTQDQISGQSACMDVRALQNAQVLDEQQEIFSSAADIHQEFRGVVPRRFLQAFCRGPAHPSYDRSHYYCRFGERE